MRSWVMRSVVALGVTAASTVGAYAEGWSRFGYGRLINNDFIGDLRDREQTGSYVSSRMFARGAVTELPGRMGEVLEFRLQGDIKTPRNLQVPAAGDRPYAGTLTLGLHTHYAHGGAEISLGGELAMTGPQTRLDQLQTALHDGLGVAPPSAQTKAGQVANGFHAGVVVEMGRSFALSDRTTLRPFVEGRSGVETLIRTGFDLSIGEIGREPLQVRDGITGQRYRTLDAAGTGVAFVIGADTALVSDSVYLPAANGLALTDTRDRARMGMHWQAKRTTGFFGVTYLGKEYRSQVGAQVVGSIRLGVDF